MKRGFLNTSKARSRIERSQMAASETAMPSPPPPQSPLSSDVSEEEATEVDLHKLPPDIREELDARNDDRKRIIFCVWPRDSRGEYIPEANDPGIRGKETSNGIGYWGATLYDFYLVFRMPQNVFHRSADTGSRLAKAVWKFGEFVAADGLRRADEEENPRQLQPYDIEKLIEESDKRIHVGDFDSYSMRKGKAQANSSGATQISFEPSFFDLSSYPYPWPFIPFALPDDTPKLQKRLPLHLLPKKLVVHDPWNVLSVSAVHKDHDTPWTQKKDIVRTYSLRLSSSGQQTVEDELKDRKAAIDASEKKAKDGPELLFMPKEEDHGPIVCVVPRRRPPPEMVPEAHLYLSAKHILGEGNHSFVYKAELELPRTVLVEDKKCNTCVLDGMEELRDSCIASAFSPNQETSNGISSHKGAEVDLSSYALDEAGSVSSAGIIPPLKDYKGPATITAHPKIRWQHPSYAPGLCEHNLPRGKGVPRTAKVQVAAKLSVQDDNHLGIECSNYQKFPAHFFEHWNGYNLIKPLRDPVPVGAVVPQFYGYYVPDTPDKGIEEDATDPLSKKEEKDSSSKHSRSKSSEARELYLSPIMLLEDCGTPITPESLTKDQKKECASLLYKFHREGWLHDSFALRNFVVQPGPLTESPTVRASSDVSSFRMIDFGRSVNVGESSFNLYSEARRAAQTLQVDKHDDEISFLAGIDSLIDTEEASHEGANSTE